MPTDQSWIAAIMGPFGALVGLVIIVGLMLKVYIPKIIAHYDTLRAQERADHQVVLQQANNTFSDAIKTITTSNERVNESTRQGMTDIANSVKAAVK